MAIFVNSKGQMSQTQSAEYSTPLANYGQTTTPNPKSASAPDPMAGIRTGSSSVTPTQITPTGNVMYGNQVLNPVQGSTENGNTLYARSALANIANTPAPKTDAEIYQEKLSQSQALIDSINAKANAAYTNAQEANKTNEQAEAFNLAARGLMGSPAGTEEQKKVNKQNQNELDTVSADRENAIATVLQNVQDRADAEKTAEQKRYDTAQQNVISGAATIASTEATNISNTKAAQDDFKSFAQSSSLSWSDIEKSDPDLAKQLLQQTGWSDVEAAFKFNAYKSAAQQIQWQTPIQTANGFMFYGVNPVTGKMEQNEVKIAVGSDWTVSPGNMYQDTILYNKSTGETKTLQQYQDAIPGNISSICKDGTTGGECGDFIHTIEDNVPTMGDTLETKQKMINSGIANGKAVLAKDWKPKIGDVVIENVGAAGHAAIVNKVNSDGTVQLTESNYNLDGKVNNSRTLSATDPAIYGAYTGGNIKSTVADGTMTVRQLNYEKLKQQVEKVEQDKSDAKSIADAIISGKQPPVLTGLYGKSAAVKAELERQGFNLSKANLDWTATQTYIKNSNSTQQVRMRQAENSVEQSLPNLQTLVDKLNSDGAMTGFKFVNRASIEAAAGGAFGKQAAVDAQALIGQLGLVTDELGQTFMGGNSPTDAAFDLAKGVFASNFTADQFKNQIALVQQNLQFRKNSWANAGVSGITGDNPYLPEQSGSSTDQYSSGDIVEIDGTQYVIGDNGELTPQ